jgi:hypothetical protein
MLLLLPLRLSLLLPPLLLQLPLPLPMPLPLPQLEEPVRQPGRLSESEFDDCKRDAPRV